MNIGEACRTWQAVLKEAGLSRPAFLIREMVAHHLGITEASLLARPERQLSEAQERALAADVVRLVQGEPVAHVLGWQPFLDWDFKVDARALIPRPETEALCAMLIERLADRPPARILDMCCGTGVLGLALGLSFPTAQVWLCDISEEALALCSENVTHHGLQARTHVSQGDLWDALSPETRFDLVVANPPYVATDDEVGEAVLAYEPHLALFSEDAGMAHIKRILAGLPERLLPGGLAAFELGHYHHQTLAPFLAQQLGDGWHFANDPFGIPRFLIYSCGA